MYRQKKKKIVNIWFSAICSFRYPLVVLVCFPPWIRGRLLYSHVCMCTSCLGTNLLGQRTNNFFLIKMICQILQKFSYTNVYEILHCLCLIFTLTQSNNSNTKLMYILFKFATLIFSDFNSLKFVETSLKPSIELV